MRPCDRCEFSPPRFEIMDRATGTVWMLCDLCMLQWACKVSDAARDEIEIMESRRDHERAARIKRAGDVNEEEAT